MWIRTRAAEKSDCRTIAELYHLSPAGVADYIWTTLANTGDALLMVRALR